MTRQLGYGEAIREALDQALSIDPDVVVMGSTTVMICKKPAARMGDSTAHGGKIVVGCPTVLIGG